MRLLPAASRSGTKAMTPQRSRKSPSKLKPPAPELSASDANADAIADAIADLNAQPLTPEEYCRITSEMPVHDIATMLQQGLRTVYRHMRGDSRIDGSTTIVLRLLDRKIVTLEDIIRAAQP
jgi:hypothetical protein